MFSILRRGRQANAHRHARSNMKKIVFLIGCIFSFTGSIAYAQPDLGTGWGGLTEKIAEGSGYDTSADEYTLSETIGRIIKIALSFIGTIFFALTVYAGFLWMTARGNDEQVGKAVGIIKTGIIGMIIILAAYGITSAALIFSARSTSFEVGN